MLEFYKVEDIVAGGEVIAQTESLLNEGADYLIIKNTAAFKPHIEGTVKIISPLGTKYMEVNHETT